MTIKKPTIKQEKAIALVVENGGNVSGAMREAGYSEATAKTPSKLTNSSAFKEGIKPFAEKLREHREQIIDNMISKVGDARYNELSGAIANIDKIVRLDAGEPTDNVSINNITKLTDDQLAKLAEGSTEGTSEKGAS